MIPRLLASITLTIVAAGVALADTGRWDTRPETSTPESPKLYAIVNARGVNAGSYTCGVMVGQGYGLTAAMDIVNASSGIPAGSFWFFTEGDMTGTVEIRNLDFPEAGLGYNPDHMLGAKGSNPADWYLLPNGINNEGLTISATSLISAYSCIDASNWAQGENGLWSLSAGWQPAANDWNGTTWIFVPVEADIDEADFSRRVRTAYFKPTGEKTVVHHTTLWDISQAKYITVDPSMYDDPNGRFSLSRMMKTENIAYLWEPAFGSNPANASGNLRMDMAGISADMEKAYRYFYDNLGFIDTDFSCIDRHYLNMYIFSSTADGALYTVTSSPVAYMCIHPFWFSQNSYFGGAAHELAHTFQGAAVIDGTPGMSTPIAESCAQFMIASYYGDWPLKEPGHIRNFMENSHLAFLNNKIHYDSPWVYEYWAEKHGRDIMGRLWRYYGSNDPVERYKQMMDMDQKGFVDEMYEAVSHFPTWDMSYGREAYASFRNGHTYKVRQEGNGVYSPDSDKNPQGYGYNAVELIVPTGSERRITLQFSGITTGDIKNTRPDNMGWRYGFAAYQRDGSTVYSPMMDSKECETVWEVPEATTNLWLVVMGAPDEHYTGSDGFCDDEFPWKARLTGTGVKGYSVYPLDTEIAGITDVIIDRDAAEEYFDMTGRRVDASNVIPGIYIRRKGNTTEKVVLK